MNVLDRGKKCINDHSTTPYADDIAWARENGISDGCDVDMFCTDNPMTRGQVATFLVARLRLPPGDEGLLHRRRVEVHEDDIDRIAEAGLTDGCATNGTARPSDATRAQVASMLARALDLPEATRTSSTTTTARPWRPT